MVTINIDEAKIRRINPKLTTRESINQWLQQWVDSLTKLVEVMEFQWSYFKS